MENFIKKRLVGIEKVVFLVFFVLVSFFSFKSSVLALDFTNPDEIISYPSTPVYPKNIVFDENGNFYITSVNQILKYDIGTSNWTVLGSGGTGVGQFDSPDGIVLDINENIYVADTLNNRIQKYDIGTSEWTIFGSYGQEVGQFYGPTGITLDTFGNIYVADTYNNKIQKYDIGTSEWTIIGSGLIDMGNFRGPKGISTDINGNIYVADTNNSQIKKYDIGTSSWIVVGIGGTGVGQFDYPIGISIDINGNIYVTDFGDQIQKYDIGTSEWTVIGTLYAPRGITSDSIGNIYAIDRQNTRIQKYDIGTSNWTVFGSYGGELGQFNSPDGIVLDINENIYVADTLNNRIQKYDIGTSSWETLGSEFYKPQGISMDTNGNIYVADTNNHRIQKYDIGTSNWIVFGSGGTGIGQFSFPMGISTDINGNIYVSDTLNNRIQKYDIGTSSWMALGIGGTGIGQFDSPMGISIDINGNIYVVDRFNDRIQKYNIGTSSWEVVENTMYGFNYPTGITLDNMGNIYVADSGNDRIQKYDIGTSSWIATETGLGQFNGPRGVAVDINGNIYMADTGNNQIKKLVYWASPSSPISLEATDGNKQVLLTWQTPTYNGGKAITDYKVEYSTDNSNWTIFADGTSTLTETTVTGLVNGQNYYFRVSAINSIGTGLFSNIVNVNIPILTPRAPTDLSAIFGDQQTSLSWTAPTDNGGAEITDYRVQYKQTNEEAWSTYVDEVSIGTSLVVTELTNEISYDFRVYAINSAGTGLLSEVVSATPIGLDPTPTPTPTGTGETTPTPTPTETVIPTPTPISIGATNINTLIGESIFVIPVGDSKVSTSKVVVANEVFIFVGEESTLAFIDLTKDTEITRENNEVFDSTQLSAANMDKNIVSGLTSGFSATNLMQWGIPGVTLMFDKPVFISMYVGNEYDGQTLSILRSPNVSSGWTNDGLVNSNCLVIDGYCDFSTNKASYFTVLSYQSPTNNQSSSNNSSSNGSSSYVCNDVPPVNGPDLFELKANKGKVKLIYTPGSTATAYAVLYGFKKGDERFGAIVNTTNNNNGVQNGDIFALNPKTTYYFKVAAINGCTISPWSEWVPVKADRTKTIYKYKTIIKNKIKSLVNIFK